jgi:SAM-dependent methyltransferase
MTDSDAARVRGYFTRSAVPFDALYGEDEMSPPMRWVNRTFRRDIYERYLRTVDHARRYGLTSALDVGCGSGRYVAGLAEAGVRRVVGVDFSPSMIELARRNAETVRGAATEFVCADFSEWEAEERFDLVIAMGFFDYVADPVPALARMRSFARHSVVASFPSVSLYRTPLRKVRYALKRCPVYFYTRGRVDSLAAAAGFSRRSIVKIQGSGMDHFGVFFLADRTQP